MIEVRDTWAIQIEITNKCRNRCSNCTHMVGHSAESWEITPKQFEEALQSLKDWPKVVGMIGGDPMLHNDFDHLMDIFKRYFPKNQRGLWTSDFKGREKEMRDFFGYVNFNPHTEDVEHTPVLCASQDLIPDPVERRKYIDECWLAEKWSPSITPKGVYRCEVAGAMDMVLNKNLGLPPSLNWWARGLPDFEEQIQAFCNLCSICIPLRARKDKDEIDDMTCTSLVAFKDSPKVKKEKIELHSADSLEIKTKDGWQPFKYLTRMR